MKVPFNLFIVVAVVVSSYSLSAQINCLQLNLDDVILDPLNSEVVFVDFQNPLFQSIQDPGFRAYNAMTEQFLGSETIAYSTLPLASRHRVFIGNSIDLSSAQQLVFELWRNEYDSLLCGYDWIGTLANTPDCFPSHLNIIPQQTGSSQDVVNIVVSDYETNEVVIDASTTLGNSATFLPQACLESGCYTLDVTMSSPAIHSYYINLFEELYIDYYLFEIPTGFTEYTGQFQIWEGCPVGVAEQDVAEISIFPTISTDGYFNIKSSSAISSINVYSSTGQLIEVAKTKGDLSSLSNGLYIVAVELENDEVVTRRLVVQLD